MTADLKGGLQFADHEGGKKHGGGNFFLILGLGHLGHLTKRARSFSRVCLNMNLRTGFRASSRAFSWEIFFS